MLLKVHTIIPAGVSEDLISHISLILWHLTSQKYHYLICFQLNYAVTIDGKLHLRFREVECEKMCFWKSLKQVGPKSALVDARQLKNLQQKVWWVLGSNKYSLSSPHVFSSFLNSSPLALPYLSFFLTVKQLLTFSLRHVLWLFWEQTTAEKLKWDTGITLCPT